MNNECTIGNCDRPIKAGGMCRHHREQHLDRTTHTIGEAKKRVAELIDHYGTIGLAARMIGIARNTAVRLQHVDPTERIQHAAYNRIMDHQAEDVPTPARQRAEPTTWADTAAYALTPEGRMFVTKCRAARRGKP